MNKNIHIHIYIYIHTKYTHVCVYIYIYIYIYTHTLYECHVQVRRHPQPERLQGAGHRRLKLWKPTGWRVCLLPNSCVFLGFVLEAPIPSRSFVDNTSLYVMNMYSDKQQLSHKIGWPVTHMHTYMCACIPAANYYTPEITRVKFHESDNYVEKYH